MVWRLPLPDKARALVAELYPTPAPTPSARAMREFLERRPVEAWMLENQLNPLDEGLRYTVMYGCWKCDDAGCPKNALRVWRQRDGVDSDGEDDWRGSSVAAAEEEAPAP